MKLKRYAAIALVLTLILTGCGSTAATDTSTASEPSAPAGMTSSLPGSSSGSTDAAEASVETAVPEEAAAVDTEAKAAAEALVGESVTALYEKIGYPQSSDYASSCLGPGEDGELVYDGFVVITYREGDSETIQSVR